MTTRIRPLRTSRRQARGVGLIEVLVSVLVLAVGLLGIAAMQATALRNSQGAFERSQAVAVTYAMFDVMRANRDAAIVGLYNIPMTCDVPTADDRISQEIRRWLESMDAAGMPNRCGQITCDADSCTVSVQWQEGRGSDDAADQQTLTTVTRI